jgi:mRNA-degrading endonuclease toxin of MazEF toxin-antitoxin module
VKHGDVFWVDLPDRGGREQRGRRPAIIWQDTSAFPRLPTVLIIPLSAQLDTLRFAGTVLVQPSAANGLAVPSVALVFQLGACDIRRIGQRLGQLDAPDLAKIREIALSLQNLV